MGPPVHVTQATSKDLLDSTGDATQSSAIIYTEKEKIRVHVSLNHFAVRLKLNTVCQLYLNLKNGKKI